MARRFLAGFGAVLFSLPVAAGWLEPGIPVQVKLIPTVVFALTLIRPKWALCVLAGFLPWAARIVPQIQAPFTSAELAELMLVPFLCVASARLIVERGRIASRLVWPAMMMASVVVVAGVVGLRAEQLQTAFPPAFIALLRHHWLTSYFGDQSAFVSLHIAMTWVEALALAVLAERLVRASPRSASWIVGWFLAGACAAAWLAWLRVIGVWSRNGFSVGALKDLLITKRISTLYTDMNAAGSLFAMYVVAATWLAFTGGRRWRWLSVAAIVILGALWVTGSRTAVASAVIALGLVWFLMRRGSQRTVILGAAVGAVLVAGVTLWNPGRDAQSSFGKALEVRVAMARITGQAVSGAPAFGIGLGKFRSFARERTTPELIALFPATAVGENAHNNFLQVLAELGAVGLFAFVWIIAACAGAVIAAVRGGRPDPAAVGVAAGLLAFCVTCLAGHPLLTVEVLYLFFLAIGITAGFGPAGASRWSSRVGLVAIGVVFVSAPVRFWLVRQTADLDRVVVGAGAPTDVDYGVEYRIAGRHSLWFISSRTRSVDIPLRLSRDSRTPCRARIDIDGRTVDTVEPAIDAWTNVTFQFDPTRKGPVSRQIELDVQGTTCGLMVRVDRGHLTTRE